MASSGDRPVGTPSSRPAGVRLGEGLLHVLRSATHGPSPSDDDQDDVSAVAPGAPQAPPTPETATYSEAHAERDATVAIRYLVAAVVVSTLATCLGLAAPSDKGGVLWVGGFVVTVLLGVLGWQAAMRAQHLAYAIPRDLMTKVLTLLGLSVLMMVPYVLSVLN